MRYIIPVPIKKFLKFNYYAVLDFCDKVTGKYDPKYPPRKLNFVGSSDFKKVGDELVTHFKKVGNLKPSDSVLDIGSGIGRMAIPLTEYLDQKAQYEGFDIDLRGIEWCQKNITPKYPHFQFQYVDIYNKYYNSGGAILAKNFVFPYADNQFDFIFATSVFTHMLPEDIKNYLSEINRVLRSGGTLFLTWFVLNPETKKLMEQKKSNAHFQYQKSDCFYSHKNNIEAETAYLETWIKAQYKNAKIDKNLTIHHGWWRGKKGLSYQDIIIAQKH